MIGEIVFLTSRANMEEPFRDAPHDTDDDTKHIPSGVGQNDQRQNGDGRRDRKEGGDVHFKRDFSHDPDKHQGDENPKTNWILLDCRDALEGFVTPEAHKKCSEIGSRCLAHESSAHGRADTLHRHAVIVGKIVNGRVE